MLLCLKILLRILTGSKELNKGDIITDPEDSFYRRAFRKDKKYVDPKTGLATSRAFTPRPKKDNGLLSVNLSRLISEKAAIRDPIRFALFTFKNKIIINIGLKAIYDPLTIELDDYDDSSHCLISGFDEEDESLAGILARSSKPVA